MSDLEQAKWCLALLVIWAVPLLVMNLTVTMSGPRALEGLQGAIIIFWVGNGIYLLILSWRKAYLSGRKSK